MKIALSGSNGYIGQNLIPLLQQEGYECIPIERKLWNGKIEKVSELLAETDVVINLAGAPILKRWNRKNKAKIYSSRVILTQKLAAAIFLLPEQKRPHTFISASAVGIYISGEIHSETSSRFDKGFLGKLVQDWEMASEALSGKTRRIIFRIGLVLGHNSKTIKNMLPAFKAGLGGKISNGNQAFPFIHIDDLTSAFIWAIKNKKAEGVYNLVAPQSITNKQFTIQLARKLNRPALFTIPSFILKLIFGEASKLLIKSPDIIPEKLQTNKFIFKKPTIEVALEDIV